MEMFDKILKKDKTEKESMSEDKANALIKEWAEHLEVRLKGEDYESLQDEIWFAVKKERLTFNYDSSSFEYVLINPIEKADGESISKITICESNMAKKKDVSKYKGDYEQMASLYKAYCTDSDGDEIEIGFLMRIKDRDQNIISAVILGFFVQAVPGKK